MKKKVSRIVEGNKMNKKELKALNKRLDDYFVKLRNNDKGIRDIDWKEAHIKSIDVSRAIIRLMLEEDEYYKVGDMTSGGWVYIGDKKPKESKADKIWSIVNKIAENHDEAAYEIHEHEEGVLELIELYRKLDELLKDL